MFLFTILVLLFGVLPTAASSTVDDRASSAVDERKEIKLPFNYTDGAWEPTKTFPHYDHLTCVPNYKSHGFYHFNNKYDWVPSLCPNMKFGSDFILNKLRNQIIVYVGDSLNRNHYYSLLCLLHGERFVDESANHTVYDHIRHYPEYNATVKTMWSNFIVEISREARSARAGGIFPVPAQGLQASILEAVNNATILMVNTGGWWFPYADLFDTSVKTIFNDLSSVFQGRIIFQLEGFNGCSLDHKPLPDQHAGFEGLDDFYKKFVRRVDALIPLYPRIEYLNTTRISSVRKDAHPSSYMTDEELKAKGRAGSDCQHWGLPGIPDIWNMILFNYHL